MYKLIISISTFLSIHAFASDSTDSIKAIYSEFLIKQNQFFSSDFSKTNCKGKTTDFIKYTQNALVSIQKIELSEDVEYLSAEGNQLAIELEYLSPLETLTKSKFSKADCSGAEHLNNVNTNDQSSSSSKISLIISKLCK